MDYDPISVALKFGFLAVLYLFVLVIARSALKDLRRTTAPAPDATGFHAAPAFAEAPRRGADGWLVLRFGRWHLGRPWAVLDRCERALRSRGWRP